jgi:hypothetical protein
MLLTSRFFIQPHYFRSREKPNTRHGLPQSHGIVISAEHYCEKRAVIFRPRNRLPFIICTAPCTLLLPSMQISEYLCPNFSGREATDNCERDATFVFIQCLMRKTTPCRRSNAALRKFQLIAFTHAPLVQRGLRQDYSERVSNASNGQFHVRVITRYNVIFNLLCATFDEDFGCYCGRYCRDVNVAALSRVGHAGLLA